MYIGKVRLTGLCGLRKFIQLNVINIMRSSNGRENGMVNPLCEAHSEFAGTQYAQFVGLPAALASYWLSAIYAFTPRYNRTSAALSSTPPKMSVSQ